MLIVLIAVALVALEGVRQQRRAALVSEYRYRLFEMRDRLRGLVMRNPDASRTWLFAYLDSTTAKSVSLLPDLSIWQLVFLAGVYRDDERFMRLSENLERELSKRQHEEFKNYEEELMRTLGSYLMERHAVFTGFVDSVDRVSAATRTLVEDTRRRSLEVALKSPETSTLSEFAPCPV